MKKPIDSFSGTYHWLSNFSPAPVRYGLVTYPTVEHAYQAAKTNDADQRKSIKLADSPGRAKHMGQRVTLRPDWETVKLDVMRDLLWQKFAPGTELARKLLTTGDAQLIEGNYWGDIFWGVCRGQGENHLGRLLMAVREKLQ